MLLWGDDGPRAWRRRRNHWGGERQKNRPGSKGAGLTGVLENAKDLFHWELQRVLLSQEYLMGSSLVHKGNICKPREVWVSSSIIVARCCKNSIFFRGSSRSQGLEDGHLVWSTHLTPKVLAQYFLFSRKPFSFLLPFFFYFSLLFFPYGEPQPSLKSPVKLLLTWGPCLNRWISFSSPLLDRNVKKTNTTAKIQCFFVLFWDLMPQGTSVWPLYLRLHYHNAGFFVSLLFLNTMWYIR